MQWGRRRQHVVVDGSGSTARGRRLGVDGSGTDEIAHASDRGRAIAHDADRAPLTTEEGVHDDCCGALALPASPTTQ